MTYKLKTYNSARHIITKEDISENTIRFAVVEVNVKDTSLYDEDSGFRDILDVAWHNLPSKQSAENFPSSLAKMIESHLSRQFELRKRIYSVSYVGIAAKGQRFFISWAGLFRVHLSINGQIKKSTRDHNLVSDPDNLNEPLTDQWAKVMGLYTPTRQLLANRTTSDRLWESVVWDAVGDYKLIICSDFYHQFQTPQEYVPHYFNLLDGDIDPSPVPGGGIITMISIIN